MPAKKIVTQKSILQTALRLVRQEGMEGLNMRSLAKACNCSTQPIYNCFSGMEQLKKGVEAQIVQCYHGYIHAEIERNLYPEYKATGLGYIRFAKEQPNYFKYLFMRNRGGATDVDEDSGFLDEVFGIMGRMGLTQDKAYELHAHMWVWVHGIATMYATGYLNWDWDTVSRMLTDAFMGIKQRLGI